MDIDSIEWSALEFEEHEKSADWFWILGIVAVVGALIAIVGGNTLFAVVIILAGFIIGTYATKHPDTLYCRVDRRGVYVNNQLYPYGNIDSFWIDETRENKTKLLMTMKNKLAIQVAIPLENVDLNDLHEFLHAYINEEQQHETLTEQLVEWLKI